VTGLGQESSLVERAVRLFTFLGQAQQLKSPSVHDVATYGRDGAALEGTHAKAVVVVG
jgi:hypothetical protein